MRPVVKLYWTRVVMGIIAGVITAITATFFDPTSLTTLINSITIALLVYFVSYYILKPMFKDKIEKQSKILSTGIGIYFFAWLAFFVLFYTIIQAVTMA